MCPTVQKALTPLYHPPPPLQGHSAAHIEGQVADARGHLLTARRALFFLTAEGGLSSTIASNSASISRSAWYCLSFRSKDACVFVQTSVCGEPLRSVSCVQSR